MTESTLLPVVRRDLPNGSALYCIIVPHLPLAILEAVVRTGSIHEGADAGCGVSHFLEHMLFQGSERYPDGVVGARVHALGGDCNAYTSFDHTAYHVELPAEKILDAADVLASMVATPLFPEAKFNSEKTVIAREADMIGDRPDSRLMQNLLEQIFAVHPAHFPIVGYPDKIAEVDRARMVNYYLRRYGAARCHWIAAGAVDPDRLQAYLAEKLAKFTRGNLDEPVIAAEPAQQFERRKQEFFADPQARLALGVRIPPASDKIIPALDVLTGILGQNDSSRLVRELWQTRELATSLNTSGFSAGFGGVFGVRASCKPEKLDALEAGVREILAKVRRDGITAAELAREKIQQKTHFYRTIESLREKLNVVNDGLLNYGTPDFAEAYLARLDALALDEVNQAAQEYLDPSRFAWSVLAPEAKMRHSSKKKTDVALKIAAGRTAAGAEYAVIRRGAIPMDSLSILLPAGPAWEATWVSPVSAMLAEMLSTGSGAWSESEFYELLDSHGMDWDVSGGKNTISMELSFPAEERALAEEIFANILLAPRWEKAVFEREKRNLAEQIASRLMKPAQAALVAARQALYGDHPAGRDQMGKPEDLAKITLNGVKKFYASRWDCDWVKLGGTAADPAAEKRIQKYFEKLSSQLPWSAKKLQKPGAPAAQKAWKNAIRIDVPREQSVVIAAVRGCTADAPEHLAIDVLDQALNGMASHLFMEVREKRSLAYTTGCALNYGLVPGMIALYAGVAPERTEEAATTLHAEIARLRERGLDKAEFEEAKRGAVSAFSKRLEEASTRLLCVLLSLFYGEAPESGLNVPERLAKLNHVNCNKMLKKLFAASHPVTVIAGSCQVKSPAKIRK